MKKKPSCADCALFCSFGYTEAPRWGTCYAPLPASVETCDPPEVYVEQNLAKDCRFFTLGGPKVVEGTKQEIYVVRPSVYG